MPVKWLMHWQPNPGATLNSQILTEVSQCVESINGVKDGRWKSQLVLYRPLARDGSISQNPEYPRDVVNLVLHEQPDKCFFVLRGSHRIVFEAEASFLGIFKKLQSYKANAVFTFEGFQYKLGDFQVRVGKCATPESLRGMMMERSCDDVRTVQSVHAQNEHQSQCVWSAPGRLVTLFVIENGLGGKTLKMNNLLDRHGHCAVEYLPLSSIEKTKVIMEDFYDIWQDAVAKKSMPGHFIHIESNFSEYGLQDHYTSQHTALQYANCTTQMLSAVRNL